MRIGSEVWLNDSDARAESRSNVTEYEDGGLSNVMLQQNNKRRLDIRRLTAPEPHL